MISQMTYRTACRLMIVVGFAMELLSINRKLDILLARPVSVQTNVVQRFEIESAPLQTVPYVTTTNIFIPSFSHGVP